MENRTTTTQAIFHQHSLAEEALRSGSGHIGRTQCGAFIIYSRISEEELLTEIRRERPSMESLREMSTVFLMGPTPRFFGEKEGRATTSWRREFLEYADSHQGLTSEWLIVLPEPYDCNWSSVDYPGLKPSEQVHAQIHWETFFINLSLNKGITVLHAHFRWSGNAGPTARCEAGRVMNELTKLDRCVINLPPDSESVPYIEAHLSDATIAHTENKFRLTRSSPLQLLTDGFTPVLSQGIHPSGASDPGQLNDFFEAILGLV